MSATPQLLKDHVNEREREPNAMRAFPVRLGGKEPLTKHGLDRDASADPSQLRAWADEFPDANIGL